jgi:hypothetical protein
MPRGDLDIPKVHAGIEHRRDEGMAKHMRVRSGDPYASGLSQVPQTMGCSMAVHPATTTVEQDRAGRTGADRLVNARPTAGGSGTRSTFVPLPHTRSTR